MSAAVTGADAGVMTTPDGFVLSAAPPEGICSTAGRSLSSSPALSRQRGEAAREHKVQMTQARWWVQCRTVRPRKTPACRQTDVCSWPNGCPRTFNRPRFPLRRSFAPRRDSRKSSVLATLRRVEVASPRRGAVALFATPAHPYSMDFGGPGLAPHGSSVSFGLTLRAPALGY